MTTIPYRANDAVLTVFQDNANKRIEISDINTVAEQIFGFSRTEIVGSPLSHFLPDKINQLISDFVEFEDNAKDLGEVLNKIHGFTVRSQDGREIPVKLKVVRSEAKGRHDQFTLVMQDETELRKEEAFNTILKENFKGHEVIDEKTGLPDRESVMKDAELVHYYAGSRGMQACFAVMEIDHFESMITRHGRDVCSRLLRQLAIMCRQKLRSEDTVGALGTKELGIILLDITNESSHMVLNRLRWLIASAPVHLGPGEDIATTVSISFAPIAMYTSSDDMLIACQKTLEIARNKGGNTIVEAMRSA